MTSARLQKLRDKKDQIQAQIKDLASRERQQQRKDDTRRKIILGAFALEHLEKNKTSSFAQTILPLLDEYVTRPQDRELLNAHFQNLGLSELPPLPPQPANESTATDSPTKDRPLKDDFPKSSTA